MRKLALVALLVAPAGPSLVAQDPFQRCMTPDSVAVSGNKRVASQTILADAAIAAGVQLNFPTVQRAIKTVFQSGQFDWVDVACVVTDSTPPLAIFVIKVVERPMLESVDVAGTSAVSRNSVRDRVDLLIARPVDPAQVARAVQRIDSLYQAAGYLARIRPETTLADSGGRASILFRVDEGHRLAISGIRVQGNDALSAKAIVGTMQTKPEGFFWWQRGEYDPEKYAQDLGEKLPTLYFARGYIDFQVVKDTLRVDRERGKALVDLQVREGPQYRVGSFEVSGNKRFSSEDVNRLYPFANQSPSLPQRIAGFVRRRPVATNVFDQTRWEDATRKYREAMANLGYIYAQVRPVEDRQQSDSGARVNLRWDVQEGSPAIVNRVEIAGNDYTSETCIRDQLVLIPGDVFSQERLIRSYQSIKNLGFFEDPLPLPETRQANEQGDVDIIFKVKEKRTGNVNFGASMGQGTGLGGFIGLDQPNLMGKCKRGSLNWQYGRYINDFSLTYTDPSVRQSQVSGSVTAYRSQSRYTIADLGQVTRVGGQLRVGLPFLNSRWTRVALSYGAERVRYGGEGLLGSVTTDNCAGCFRSTFGLDVARDTRIEMPFPSDGTLQSVGAQFNGGPLGGSASFQRYTTEFRTFATLHKFGEGRGSPSQIKLVAGLSQRAGMVAGNAGPFFSSQEFAMGGVQYGEPLRGYPEFSITPLGYNPNTSTNAAVRGSFGNAFFSATAEIGVRFSQQLYVNTFFEAGNLWQHPRDFNPTRLFRGTGVGVSVITPLGPLGLDWALGLDRVDFNGRPDPKWQIHFRLGQFFN